MIKKLVPILIATSIIAGLVLVYIWQNVDFSKSERRNGTLFLFRGHCILTPDGSDLNTVSKRSDNYCSFSGEKNCVDLSGTDGLDLKFCKSHEDLLGKKITILGRRAGSEDIGQDCLNRSCFTSVTLDGQSTGN